MCYAGYDGIGETCWCWDATPESDGWVMESANWKTVDSTVLELWSDQWSLHQRCFYIDVSSLSRSVVRRCLADSVLASSSAGRCDVPRLDVLTYARQFLLWAYFTYLLWGWILCVGLFLSVVFTRRFRFACVLVIMAGNCFWCILEEMFLVVWRVYNGRLCGRSFSWTSGEVVAVRRVGVFVWVWVTRL